MLPSFQVVHIIYILFKVFLTFHRSIFEVALCLVYRSSAIINFSCFEQARMAGELSFLTTLEVVGVVVVEGVVVALEALI